VEVFHIKREELKKVKCPALAGIRHQAAIAEIHQSWIAAGRKAA
jgi:hypothetical protein